MKPIGQLSASGEPHPRLAGSPGTEPVLGSDHRIQECAVSVSGALEIRVTAMVAPALLPQETTWEGAA